MFFKKEKTSSGQLYDYVEYGQTKAGLIIGVFLSIVAICSLAFVFFYL